MKRISLGFLQGVIVLIGLLTLFLLIRLPLTEGRAQSLDVYSIYSDPFILYGYAASIAFFIALYKAFQLLGYVRNNQLFSSISIKTLKSIRYCAVILSVLIVLAGVFIKLFHHKDDDPAGFLGLCIVTTFIAIVVATVVAVLERILQNAIDLKSENDLTI